MASSTVPPIGARLRVARRRRGLSVRGLAREIGVSASLISQIETDKSSHSVSTLYAITTALEISIEDLFGEAPPVPPGADVEDEPEDEPDPAGPTELRPAELAAEFPAGVGSLVSVTRLPLPTPAAYRYPDVPSQTSQASPDGRTGASVPDDAAIAGHDRRVGPVVPPDKRELLTLDSGVTWELLGRIPKTHVDFLVITYQPGGTSSSSGLLMRHSGTEFGYVISGELTLTLGFDTHKLRAGDAVSFDSTTPHAYRNESTEPAIGVWFVVERST